MEILIQAGQLLLSLSLLIVLHELGHFIPAKIFKTRVEKFYLFFDWKFSLWKTKRGDTEYGIGWLPLGGYVKISGMIDESMDTEQMKQEPQPWEFRSKPVWQRLIIMVGGVTVNIILGFLIYAMILGVWGKDELPPAELTYGYAVSDLYKDYGMRDGDVVLEVNGEELEDAMAINKKMLFTTVENIKVMHEDGTDTIISFPEDIEFEVFRSEAQMVPRFPAVIDTVVAGSPAADAGILAGDRVLAVNDSNIMYWHEMTKLITTAEDGAVSIVVEHSDKTKDTLSMQTDKEGHIGIAASDPGQIFDIKHTDYGFFESIPAGISLGMNTLNIYASQMKFLFTKKGASSVGGFGTFGKLFPPTWEWEAFWRITAFISIILAFMNILPIPALDGGHVMFLLYEMIAGRPPNQKFLEYAQLVGFVIILGLVLYANGADIVRALQ